MEVEAEVGLKLVVHPLEELALGGLELRASRFMSIPWALLRRKRSAPSGLSMGIMWMVAPWAIRCARGWSGRSWKKRTMSTRAMDAVLSSPCICDQSRTVTGPEP